MLTFAEDNWKTLHPFLYVVSVTDPAPERAAASAAADIPGTTCVTPTGLLQDIKYAIIHDTKRAFYEKYCTPAMLVLAIEAPDALSKDTLQLELSMILSVRTVNELPTLLIFRHSRDTDYITNTSLRAFLYLDSGGMRTYDDRQRNKLQHYIAKMEQYPGYFDEEELMELDEPALAVVKQTYRDILDNLEERVHALEQKFRQITGKIG